MRLRAQCWGLPAFEVDQGSVALLGSVAVSVAFWAHSWGCRVWGWKWADHCTLPHTFDLWINVLAHRLAACKVCRFLVRLRFGVCHRVLSQIRSNRFWGDFLGSGRKRLLTRDRITCHCNFAFWIASQFGSTNEIGMLFTEGCTCPPPLAARPAPPKHSLDLNPDTSFDFLPETIPTSQMLELRRAHGQICIDWTPIDKAKLPGIS